MALVYPKAFLDAAVTTNTQTKANIQPGQRQVTARIDMSAEVAGAGLCPECRTPMEAAHANGIPVLICRNHRIAIPTADAPEVVSAEEKETPASK
jgi:hypothetical protein